MLGPPVIEGSLNHLKVGPSLSKTNSFWTSKNKIFAAQHHNLANAHQSGREHLCIQHQHVPEKTETMW